MNNKSINLNWKLIEKIIDNWESITDTNQYRDCYDTRKELIDIYIKKL